MWRLELIRTASRPTAIYRRNSKRLHEDWPDKKKTYVMSQAEEVILVPDFLVAPVVVDRQENVHRQGQVIWPSILVFLRRQQVWLPGLLKSVVIQVYILGQ